MKRVLISADVSATIHREFLVDDDADIGKIDYTELFWSEQPNLTDEERREISGDPYVDPYQIQECEQ